MKKILIVSFLLFFLNITNVSAYEQATRTCIYQQNMTHSYNNKTWKEYLDVTFMGLGTGMPMLGDINYYKLYSDNSKETIFSADATEALNYYVNWDRGISGISTEYSYWTTAIITQKEAEVAKNDDKSLICPSNIYILEYTIETGKWNPFVENGTKQQYDLYACGNNYGDYNNDTCPQTRTVLSELRKTANYDGTAGILSNLEYFTGTLITNVGQKDPTKTNVQDQYNEVETTIEENCEEQPENQKSEECLKAELEKEQYVDQAEDQGISKEQLEKGYGDFKAQNNIKFEEGSCDTLLGSIHNPKDPAYYLDFAFKIIKYLAIVLLFVYTIVEYSKAITSSNQDAIKKATQATIKRLIIAIIIFFLPILINFILSILGIVSTNATCGIG